MLNEKDYQIVKSQLGRSPRGAKRVVCYGKAKGEPQVIEVHPLVEGKPFPSLFWLTCPRLHKAIAKIEQTAWIKHLENTLIPEDPKLKEQLQKDHLRYQELRWQKLSEEEKNSASNAPYLESLRKTGIGGVRDFSRVRCLHMHYAHHLAEKNVIGELMDQEFQTYLYL